MSDSWPPSIPPPQGVVSVLVVENSPVVRELLVSLLNQDPLLQVIGVACDGEEAVVAAQRLGPDVIVMDIHLPKQDGFLATRAIMETCPTRIVMATAVGDPHEVSATFRAMDAGALAVLAKPVGPGHPGFAAAVQELVRTVKLMSEVPVVKRWSRPDATPLPPFPLVVAAADIRLVAIGASTGGPLALRALLSKLPKDFAVPIMIVQHIALGFVEGFAEWLAVAAAYPVQVAQAGMVMRPGCAYVAPDNLHMQVLPHETIELVEGPKEHGVRPAVSVLFRSVAARYGPRAAGVLLTGMGRDGAQELRVLRLAGAVTLAQNRASSVVHGMPAEAIRLNAAAHVLPPDMIARVLGELLATPADHRRQP